MQEIRALARMEEPECTSWGALQDTMLEAANALRLEAGQTTAPVHLDSIARLRRIYKEEFLNRQGAPQAIIVPVSNGFILKLQPGLPSVRKRFSIAHEIGHTLFYDINASPPARLLVPGSLSMLSQKEEGLCNAFASELLLPRELINSTRHNLPNICGLQLLLSMAGRFWVSVEVAVRQLLQELPEFHSTAIISKTELTIEGKYQTHIQKHLGKALKTYLRKKERHIMDLVTGVINSGPPYTGLEDMRLLYSDSIQLEWKTGSTNKQGNMLVMLRFRR